MVNRNFIIEGSPLTVAEFGNGTIAIVNAKNDEGEMFLLMKTIPKTPIDSVVCPNERTLKDFKPELLIVFKNEDSFSVLIESINKIKYDFRELMLDEEDMRINNSKQNWMMN